MKSLIVISLIGVFSIGLVFSFLSPVYGPLTEPKLDDRHYSIPSWVKGIAGFWSEGKITDDEFGEGISFLIDNNILKVPKIQELESKIAQLENENRQLKTELGGTEDINIGVGELNPSSDSSSEKNCSGFAKCVSERVTQIIDGDTVYTTSYKIRLSLTNTPERGESGYSEATLFTNKMCPVGSMILIDQDDKQQYDAYGRLLANVYCNGESLNSALLYKGHADILTQYCSSSEFSEEKWAQDFGCGSKSTYQSAPSTQSSTPSTKSSTSSQSSSKCDPSYPDFCIPPPPPDLDCKDIPQKRFTVLQPDPHRFDGDKDGIGCES